MSKTFSLSENLTVGSMEVKSMQAPRTPPRPSRVFPILMPPRPLSIEVDAILEKEAAVFSPTGPRTRSPSSVTPISRLPSPTAEETVLREQMDQVMLDVANRCQERNVNLQEAFPDDNVKVTSSELAAFLTGAGIGNASETAEKLIVNSKRYIGDSSSSSPVGLKVHTLKQALRVAVARSLRPRSRSSCHSSPATRPHSRLSTPLSAHVPHTPTLGLVDENAQPLKASTASSNGFQMKAGKSRFADILEGSNFSNLSSERAPQPVVLPSVSVEKNSPVLPGKRTSLSLPTGLVLTEKGRDGDQYGSENATPLLRKSSIGSLDLQSAPKLSFVDLRDLNARPLPGFISQVAVTASAKLQIAAGTSALGNGTQRKLNFGAEKSADPLLLYCLGPSLGKGKKRAAKPTYRTFSEASSPVSTMAENDSSDSQLGTPRPSQEGTPRSSQEGTPRSPLSPLKYLIRALSLASLWNRDSPKAEKGLEAVERTVKAL